MSGSHTARIGYASCLAGAAFGAIGLLGWITGVGVLTRFLPGEPPMMPNTAVALIALATHGRSGLGRLTYGSVAERTLLTTTRPLLLIWPDGWAAVPRSLQRIVVALDGSPEAERGLATGQPHLTHGNAEIGA